MATELAGIAKEKMEKTIESFRSDLETLKAGRANPHMLDKIMVDYYGSPTPIAQIAGIASPEPRVLTISPWDASALKSIEKAILASDLGLNPSNDGKMIRLIIPTLTEERRKDLLKLVNKNGEECRVALRNIRRNLIEDLKKQEKAKEITEDDVKDGEKEIQKVLDDFIKKTDEIIKKKEEEIMTV
ncbi:MAG: ribosome recycling factor [Eubacteriaceae bacterium]|nr:ribosome recycling factor [Eubacteriaceae bacterium]MBQ1466307.1 ribosome recycling factor [Eubacteriaceae bacterium]